MDPPRPSSAPHRSQSVTAMKQVTIDDLIRQARLGEPSEATYAAWASWGCIWDSYVAWFVRLPWELRLDLTFRAGAEGCDVGEVSADRSRRCVDRFMQRLADTWRVSALCAGFLEMQERGVPHWHVLIHFERGGVQWRPQRDVLAIWQYWRRWTRIDQRQGVEGWLWQVYLRGRDVAERVRYAVKYAAKRPQDWYICRYVGHDEAKPDRRRRLSAVVPRRWPGVLSARWLQCGDNMPGQVPATYDAGTVDEGPPCGADSGIPLSG
jgi:hypothetical protein